MKELSENHSEYMHQTCYICCFVTHSCPTLWPHGLQHARLPGYSLSPGVCSNSCSLSWWHCLTISPSASPSSFCLHFFPPGSVSFPMSQLFPSGGQVIGASASASVLPINIWGWFPLGLTDLISLLLQGALKNLLQYNNLKKLIFWH